MNMNNNNNNNEDDIVSQRMAQQQQEQRAAETIQRFHRQRRNNNVEIEENDDIIQVIRSLRFSRRRWHHERRMQQEQQQLRHQQQHHRHDGHYEEEEEEVEEERLRIRNNEMAAMQNMVHAHHHLQRQRHYMNRMNHMNHIHNQNNNHVNVNVNVAVQQQQQQQQRRYQQELQHQERNRQEEIYRRIVLQQDFTNEEDRLAFDNWTLENYNRYIRPVQNLPWLIVHAGISATDASTTSTVVRGGIGIAQDVARRARLTGDYFPQKVHDAQYNIDIFPLDYSGTFAQNSNVANHRDSPLFHEWACVRLGKYIGARPCYTSLIMNGMFLNGKCVRGLFLPWREKQRNDGDDNDGGDDGENNPSSTRRRKNQHGIAKELDPRGSGIVKLDLSCNRAIGSSGIIGLSPLLYNNSTLKVLLLSNVQMGSEGAGILADILSNQSNEGNCFSSLEILDVSSNGLKDEGIEKLTKALRKNVPLLKEVNVSSNRINQYSSFSLLLAQNDEFYSSPLPSYSAEYYAPPLSLVKLDMCGNCLNDNCIHILSNLLQTNNKLTVLDLRASSRITLEGWKSLEKLVYNSSSINALYTSNHILQSFGMAKKEAPMIYHNKNIIQKALNINGMDQQLSINERGRRKVWSHFFPSGYAPLSQHVLDIDIQYMPFVLSKIANEETFHPKGYTCHDSLYHMLKTWNVPLLYIHLSQEAKARNERDRVKDYMDMLEPCEEKYCLEEYIARLERDRDWLMCENKKLCRKPLEHDDIMEEGA